MTEKQDYFADQETVLDAISEAVTQRDGAATSRTLHPLVEHLLGRPLDYSILMFALGLLSAAQRVTPKMDVYDWETAIWSIGPLTKAQAA